MEETRIPGEAGRDLDCIHRLFEASVAVVEAGRSANYAELDSRANALAHALAGSGVSPNVVVGLVATRSIETIAGVLGILKSGAAFLPLDPEYPRERLRFLVSDSGAPLVVAPPSGPRLAELPSEVMPMPDEERASAPDTPVTLGDLAYVIYTSGSTGIPKGVLIEHAGLARLLTFTRRQMEIRPTDRVLQFASLSFDASIWEIFAALVSGATLVLGSRESLLPGPNLHRFLKEHRVSIALLSPSVLRMLEPEGLDDLRIMVAGTEKLTADLVERWAPGRRFFNAYGPTETTIYSTILEVERPSGEEPTIGKPVPGTEVYIVGDDLRPIPHGKAGQLAIAGMGVARGYLNRDELTQEKFVAVSLDGVGERRIYLTGDRARMREDGNVEYLGRTDFQVKVRGFRVELGEIETVLEGLEGVGSAAVVAAQDGLGQTLLRAYFVPEAGKSAAAQELRNQLLARLPEPMVPSVYIELDRWPLSPNGKLDRSKLPPPPLDRGKTAREELTPTERALARVLSEVLGGSEVGPDDPFALAGLHSLSIAQVVAGIEKALHVRLKYSEVYAAGTLRRLGALVEKIPESPRSERLGRETSAVEEVPLSLAQEGIWILQKLYPDCRAYEFQSRFSLKGVLDVDSLGKSLNEIVSRHEILRTSFPASDGVPVQRVHPFEPFHLPVDEVGSSDELERRIREELGRPFDLSRLPLVRWRLFRLGGKEHVLLHHEHHFLHDGWSYGVFLEELAAAYAAFSEGRRPELARPSLQYREFAARERERLSRGEFRRGLDFWKRKLEEAPPPLRLPSDRPRPRVRSFRGGQLRHPLERAIYGRLLETAARERVTAFTWLQAVFQVLLHRYTGAEDVVVGSGFANRASEDRMKMLGMVINTVPIRVRLDGRPEFRELLQRVHATVVEAADHQDVPFPAVVREINPPRFEGQAFFDAFFDSYDQPLPEWEPPGLVVEREDGIGNGRVKFDLVVLVVPRTASKGRVDSSILIWEYATDLFDLSTAASMLADFLALLESSLEEPATSIDRLLLASRRSPSAVSPRRG